MPPIVVSKQKDYTVTAAQVVADQFDKKIVLAPKAIDIVISEMSVHNTVTMWCSCALYFVDDKDHWHRLLDQIHTPTNVPIIIGPLEVRAKKLGFFVTRGLETADIIRTSYSFIQKKVGG